MSLQYSDKTIQYILRFSDVVNASQRMSYCSFNANTLTIPYCCNSAHCWGTQKGGGQSVCSISAHGTALSSFSISQPEHVRPPSRNTAGREKNRDALKQIMKSPLGNKEPVPETFGASSKCQLALKPSAPTLLRRQSRFGGFGQSLAMTKRTQTTSKYEDSKKHRDTRFDELFFCALSSLSAQRLLAEWLRISYL